MHLLHLAVKVELPMIRWMDDAHGDAVADAELVGGTHEHDACYKVTLVNLVELVDSFDWYGKDGPDHSSTRTSLSLGLR